MRRYKKLMAGLLAGLLIMCVPASALADGANTPKEEVVYINTSADGSVKEINVVNIFELAKAGTIIDYGIYDSVRNMTTTDAINYAQDKATIDASAGKLYYEGKLSSTDMPWNISIRYYMDGKEYSATDIAGMSGKLKIKVLIDKNAALESNFYENYALQASFVLDTDLCENIQAEGATVANVGSDKQLTYTILPNQGADFEITADVTDFEMESISINGIQLNLNIDIDEDMLKEKVGQLFSASSQLRNGADTIYKNAHKLSEGTTELLKGSESLDDGTDQLYSATGTLNEKVGEMKTGVQKITDGAASINEGLTTLADKNTLLTDSAWSAYEAICSSVGDQINAKLADYNMPPITLTPDNYKEIFPELIALLDSYASLLPNNQKLQEALKEMKQQLADAETQLDAYGKFYNGLVSYTNSVADSAESTTRLENALNDLNENTSILADAVGELHNAASELEEGADLLADGSKALSNGSKKLANGAAELKNGTDKFSDGTGGIDEKISTEIDSIVADFTGDPESLESFVSDKNTNINAVQFVIKTDAIAIQEAVSEEATEEQPLTLWQKFLRLFGLY